MFRLAYLSKSFLASLLVTSYVAGLGFVGLAGGFVAHSLSAHVIGSTSASASLTPRPDSRVERWLKSQTIVYSTALSAGADLASSGVVSLNSNSQNPKNQYQDNKTAQDAPAAREIPRAAILAAAMDRSEQFVARIARPVHQRSHFSDRCLRSASCGRSGAAAKTTVAAKTRENGKLVQAAGLVNGQAAGRKAKRLGSNAVRIAALKLVQPVPGKMVFGLKPSVVAVVKPSRGPALHVPGNVLLADSPAEIIRRSLRGTT